MARFRLSSHNLGVELGRHQGVVGLRVAASNVQLWECTIFLWMTKPNYSFRAQLMLWLGGSVYLHNCHLTSLQDLMCCLNVYGVALFVHKCMKIADAVAVAAARQQPR
jgi:hypothetical protein